MASFDFHSIPAHDDEGRLRAVVETPAGCRNKYKYDPALGQFRLDKVLPAGATFPYDFGFVPRTRGEDGDPLDVLVLADEAMFTGCIVTVRLVGVIEATQKEDGEKERNDRLIGVIDTERNPAEIRTLADVPATLLDAIEHFFISYNEFEGRKFVPKERGGPAAAEKLLRAGMRAFAGEAGSGAPAANGGRKTAKARRG